MTRVRFSSWPTERAVPYGLAGLGLALGLAFVVETAIFSGLDPDALFRGSVVFSLSFALGGGGALVYGGYWLSRSSLPADRHARVAGWCLGSAGVMFGLNLLLQWFLSTSSLWAAIGLLRGTATFGAALGLLIGILEARAIQNAVEAERSSMRAGYLETQRDWLDYLNGLLRHEVLNTSQVVLGYADSLLARDDLDDRMRSQLQAIQRQSEDMTAVIEDIRLLIDATHGETDLQPVDLLAVLREEIQDLVDTYGTVTIETELPAEAAVRADVLVARLFSNLLNNAVEHNDTDAPEVTVTVEVTEESAVVTVADNGPGLPAERREAPFKRHATDQAEPGIGLFVVDLLAERYGGSVELTETGPTGTVFTVELPLATTPPAERSRDISGAPPTVDPPARAQRNGHDTAPPDQPDAADPHIDGGSSE